MLFIFIKTVSDSKMGVNSLANTAAIYVGEGALRKI